MKWGFYMSHKRKITLRLDASYKVKHEKYENFKESFFSEGYEQASQMIKEIVDVDEQENGKRTDRDYTEPISNIVAFIGKRGSGKTSAMLSFCDFLKCFGSYERDSAGSKFICKDLLQMNEKISFTVLNCIDATLIENPKDLMGAILGNMRVVIGEREKKDIQSGKVQHPDIRKLKSNLGNIYCSLEPDMSQNMEDTASEVLEQLSRSWNQQQAFRKAVHKFNEYMLESKSRVTRNYLVVPIDDVDMNLEKGYQLLEVIRKYLMGPNVIVILATDYQQLDGLCRKSYSKLLPDDNREIKVGQLATEYMEKMIPTGRRIFMPDLYSEPNLGYTTIEVEDFGGQKHAIKDVVLRNVWEHSGIILNRDYEIHWIQPNSLRKLSNYYNSFRYLADYDKTSKSREEAYDNNIKWLFEDIFRFLKAEEGEDYKIAEIIRSFWSDLPQNKISGLISELKTYKFNTDFVGVNYTYGAVMGVLFQIQRDGKFSALVHAVLMVLSLYMRRLMFDLEHFPDDDKKSVMSYVKKFSQNEFWGDNDAQNNISKSSQNSEIQYQSSRKMECGELLTAFYNREEIESENVDARKTLMLAMQIGLQRVGDKCQGTFRFGNFVNASFDYESRLNEIKDIITENPILTQEQKKEIGAETQRIINEFKQWEKENKTTRVIPFDSVEFMLHIFDELYGDGGIFYGVGESSDFAGRYKQQFKEAINAIGNILRSYDVYFEESRNKFHGLEEERILIDFTRKYLDAYESNPFVKYVKDENQGNSLLDSYIEFFAKKPESENKKSGGKDAKDSND